MSAPTPPLLLGLTGRAGAGKDTVAAYLEAQYAFAPIGFADPIRDMLGVLLQHVEVDGAWLCERDLKELPAPVLGLSYRALAQTLGTEWGRSLRADLWLRIGEYRTNQRLDAGDNVVLCDVRFPNEAAWLKAAGGVLVRVERDSVADVRAHESEQHTSALEADHVIENNSSLGALEHRIDALMDRLRTTTGAAS